MECGDLCPITTLPRQKKPALVKICRGGEGRDNDNQSMKHHVEKQKTSVGGGERSLLARRGGEESGWSGSWVQETSAS